MDEKQKNIFACSCKDFLNNYRDISCVCMTVYKPNVLPHIREDSHKLYNYMVGLMLIDKIHTSEVINFIPDPRTIKVESGNSLFDYLQMQLWFDKKVNAKLINNPRESSTCKGVQFADMLAGIVQQKFEDGICDRFNLIRQLIDLKTLYFPKK